MFWINIYASGVIKGFEFLVTFIFCQFTQLVSAKDVIETGVDGSA